MTEPDGRAPRRRRKRSRSHRPDAGTAAVQPAGTEQAPATERTRADGNRPRRGGRPGDSGERGLRNLVGAGPSQLGVSGALRGRDVNRPTDEDLAVAEREIQIVRRNWKPPA